MLSKIYKSEWLPVFGQGFVLVELENCGQAGRFGNIVTVTFHTDSKGTTVTPLSVDAQLPAEFFSDEAVIQKMALLGQNALKNQVYELGKKLSLNWLTYLPDVSFSETNIQTFLLTLTHYKAFDILKDIKFRSAGEFATQLSRLRVAKESWRMKIE